MRFMDDDFEERLSPFEKIAQKFVKQLEISNEIRAKKINKVKMIAHEGMVEVIDAFGGFNRIGNKYPLDLKHLKALKFFAGQIDSLNFLIRNSKTEHDYNCYKYLYNRYKRNLSVLFALSCTDRSNYPDVVVRAIENHIYAKKKPEDTRNEREESLTI